MMLPIDGVNNLRTMFARAGSKLKWPKITYRYQDELNTGDMKIKISQASERSRYPRGLHVVIDGQYVGTIPSDSNVIMCGPKEVIHFTLREERALKALFEDPMEALKISGKKYNICCFCQRELENASSVYYGYGPICASNYDLPWGDVPESGKSDDEKVLANLVDDVFKNKGGN